MRQLLASFALACAVLSAQEFRATISGRVTDAQDAAIAGVKLTATQPGAGSKFETLRSAGATSSTSVDRSTWTRTAWMARSM